MYVIHNEIKELDSDERSDRVYIWCMNCSYFVADANSADTPPAQRLHELSIGK